MFVMVLEGLEELRKDFIDAQRTLSRGINAAVAEACTAGANEARATHRYQDRTGKLTASIRAVLPSGGAGMLTSENEGSIVATAPYASFVEGGTRRHDIKARRVPNLIFWWPKVGAWFIGPKVDHPGTPPLPFMGQAYLKAERVLLAAIERSIPKAQAVLER